MNNLITNNKKQLFSLSKQKSSTSLGIKKLPENANLTDSKSLTI